MTEVSRFAARVAREKRVPVLLNAGSARPGMVELAVECDYVVGSEQFGREIGWTGDSSEFNQRLRELGLGLTTITFGEKGSITFAGNRLIEMPAFPVETIDTTGAGDVFHGGYIYGLLQGWDIEELLKFASALAAMKCRALGETGLPSLDEVKRFLGENSHIRPISRKL